MVAACPGAAGPGPASFDALIGPVGGLPVRCRQPSTHWASLGRWTASHRRQSREEQDWVHEFGGPRDCAGLKPITGSRCIGESPTPRERPGKIYARSSLADERSPWAMVPLRLATAFPFGLGASVLRGPLMLSGTWWDRAVCFDDQAL
jgi:hypothetical protein